MALVPHKSLLLVYPLVLSLLPGMAAAASLNVYLSAPGQQSTYITGAKTENFNSLSLGIHTTPYTSSIGTYLFSSTSKAAILNADQYGGANNSRYISVGAQSGSSTPYALALNAPATYFGFWWSAGDVNNGISFYYNNTFLNRVTTADIIHLLNSNNGVVTAVDGTKYASRAYYGNPNNGRDPGEPFGYVDIFAMNTGFNKIVFDNSGTAASGFETDNQSVYRGAAAPNGASVFVENVPAVPVSLTPEPASLALSVLGILGFVAFLRRSRRA